MPELPEVEVCRRQLARWTNGRALDAVTVVDRAVVRKQLSNKPSDVAPDGAEQLARLVGRVPDEPVRYGKRLGWAFGDRGLLCHLGMTGEWVRRPTGDPQPDLARLALRFGDHTLWYLDGRRFGCVVVVPAPEIAAGVKGDQGPDLVLEPVDAATLAARVRSRKPIKVALMEQDRVAGLGNIHAAEACFRAKISPRRKADGLTPTEWATLNDAISTQLRWSIDAEGEHDELVYVNLGGPNPFSVYKKDGEPCPVCRTPIASEDLGGRTTYWCPRCQPDPDPERA